MLFCVGDFFGTDDAEWQQVTSGAIKGMQHFQLYVSQTTFVK